MIAIGFPPCPLRARMMAEVLAIGEREYVTAARAIGAPARAIVLRHILPNSISFRARRASALRLDGDSRGGDAQFPRPRPAPAAPTWGSM